MSTPTPSPQARALQRVLSISRLNGWSVAVIAGLGTLVTLLLGDFSGTFVGLLAVSSGVMEIRGHRQLKRRDPEGMKWLVRAQLLLLGVMLVYCITRLGSFDADTAMANLTPDMEAVLQEAGLHRSDILPLVRTAYLATYAAVALTCLIYQGGLALYYRSRIRPVTEALAEPPSLHG
ncbi:MAG TPA: hypothetical protein VIM71_12970 [Lacunisphaera sp.]